MFDINGKVALITGGASGLGLAYAKELLRNGLKAVALVDVNEEFGEKASKEISEEFGVDRAIFIKTDITDKIQFEEAFKETVATFKNLDIVINNAGILNDSTWEREIAININGTVHGMLLAFDNYLPKYRSGPQAVVVNVSSIAGLDPSGSFPIYTVTKHAIVGLSRAFATKLNYERTHVKVLTLCPGVTITTGLMPLGEKSPFLGPEYQLQLQKEGTTLTQQAPIFVAKAMVEIIIKGDTGSIWVAEASEPPYVVSVQTRQERRQNH